LQKCIVTFFKGGFVMKSFSRSGVAVIAGLCLTPALAQVAGNGGPIGEIIVTAERREASIQEVPLAVSALSTEQLDNLQIKEATDLQRIVPSLHMFNNITSPTNLSLSMRGGLQQDASLVVAESPVGIYVDDIYVGRLNGNNSTLSDIERVEVLRGPQGTLYGRNTGYGAIKFVSRLPGDEQWLDISGGIGNYNQKLLKASLGGPLGESWAGSLAGQVKQKDEQWTNVFNGDETGDESNKAVRGKLRFRGIEGFDAVASLAWARSENDSLQMVHGRTDPSLANRQFTTDDLFFPNWEWGVNYRAGKLLPEPLRDQPQGETQQTIAGLTLAWDIGEDMTLKSITGYVATQDYFHTDFSANMADPTQAFATVGASDIESDQYTEELQLLGSAFGDRLNYIVGLFYLHEEADQQFGWNLPNFAPLAGLGGALSQSFIDTESDSYAAFINTDYALTDKLKLTAGLRWTKDEKELDFSFCNGPPLCPPLAPTLIDIDVDSDEWTPRIGVDYSIDPMGFMDGMLVYAQAARGYKGAGFSAISLFSPSPVGPYDPETNWTYEAGLKADWFGNRLRTNLAYFWSEIEDIQQNATDTSQPGVLEFPVENSGDAEIHGVEFEFTLVPIDRLNIFAGGALMHGKYKNLNDNSAAAAARVLYGVTPRTPQTPNYTVSVGFDYRIDLPGEILGDLSFGADYYKIDDYVTAATNDFYNSGWDIWNAFIAVDIEDNWELKFTGKNLSDDFIVTSGSRGLGGFIVLPPREFLLSLTYSFGG